MDKTLGFLGILNRGRRVLIGEAAYLGYEKGYYAFLAYDASENSQKEAQKALKKNDMPVDRTYSKEELGSAIGYDEISFLIIADKKAAKKLILEKGDKQ